MLLNKVFQPIVQLLTITCLSGCYTHVWTGGTAYFPEGTDYYTSEFRMYVEFHGAAKCSYYDNTPKEITLLVIQGEKDILLLRNYRVTASDLDFHASLKSKKDLEVVFYDYGEGISHYDNSDTPPNLRQIFTLNFSYDDNKNIYVESETPSTILQKIVKEKERQKKRHILIISFKKNNSDISAVLDEVSKISEKYKLVRKQVPPGLIGLLANYQSEDFNLEVHYYDPSIYSNHADIVEISLEDYGNIHLTNSISKYLKENLKYEFKTRELSPNMENSSK